MDPNETLKKIRAMSEKLLSEEMDDARQAEFNRLAEELALHIVALDGWLKQGGFLPNAWTGARL